MIRILAATGISACLVTHAAPVPLGPAERVTFTHRGALPTADLSRLPRFATGDAPTSAALNEWFLRHLSVDERGIYLGGGPILGAVDHMWVVEWDAWMLPWVDRGAMGLARQGGDATDVPMSTLANCTVDKYGYVFGGALATEPNTMLGGYKPMFGWPWPKYDRNTTTPTPCGWDFNEPGGRPDGRWGAADLELAPGYEDGRLVARVSGPAPALSGPALDTDTFQAPILEIDIEYETPAGRDARGLVGGLRLLWCTDQEPTFAAERSVGVGFSVLPPADFAADYQPYVSAQRARYPLYFPMYLHPGWGTGGRRLTGLRVVPCGTGNEGVSIRLNYLRATYDVRLTTTNTALINATQQFYMWSGDTAFLARMLPRLRCALLFLNEHLQGRRDGMLCLDWFVGHDGLGGEEPGHGMIGSYWDLLPAGRYDLESSAQYYLALRAMAALERAAVRHGLPIPSVDVLGPDNRTRLAYQETPESLERLAVRAKRTIEKRLWCKDSGRFARNLDAHGERRDYGYLHHNLQALAWGIGTATQRRSILSWLDARVVPGDTASGADILHWRFAPRTSTRRNTAHYFWPWIADWKREPDSPYRVWGDQMQDGGAVPYTAFFELLARCRGGEPEQLRRAAERVAQIVAWYQDVRAAGGQGRDFYRAYYDGHPERGKQQSPMPGGLGLDREFLSDASLGTVFLPFAFLGLRAQEDGELEIAPAVPPPLAPIAVENVLWRGNHLRIEAGEGWVSLVGSTIVNAEGLVLRVRLPAPSGKARVTVDGRPVRMPRSHGGQVDVVLPLAAVRLALEPLPQALP